MVRLLVMKVVMPHFPPPPNAYDVSANNVSSINRVTINSRAPELWRKKKKKRDKTAMASEEERALERQLEFQLQEQKDSLAAINDALDSDPTNPELLSVQEELVQAIGDAEDGLLHLKRSRLLREADTVLSVSGRTTEDVKAEPLDPTEEVEPEPLEEQSFSVGSRCRFRYSNGRWYNGRIFGLDDSNTAKISFLTPTSENMLVRAFLLCVFMMDNSVCFL
ncbi:hypothetical protein Tsubulata_022214 [Turnera subulata]|uniref:Tudor domain-containing protein n=1 Tax=Turnera subulata TaxID=218843 RepID=A0A9Q0JBY1_9ROSI|nr:hypothetical protein Tsubulata_022214 [Turnera subulata]